MTSADVGKWSGTNVPQKSNFDRKAGLAAKTGGSNFDIAEWMLQLLRPLSQRSGWLAVLYKRSVARKLLARFWADGVRFEAADLYLIDAKRWFGASVEAGLLVVRCGPATGAMSCTEHARLATSPQGAFGWRDGKLVADAAAYDRWHHLDTGRTWGCCRVLNTTARLCSSCASRVAL
ncbi:hypothetical protein [Brasilonema bromeliae]|uniref:hypothetical protein n=1 Tax=Brasilonema bromeliae TaxID=383615 RepID=UPI00145E2E7E|nr:hypothetical protein [Brasilonema bromeliae]